MTHEATWLLPRILSQAADDQRLAETVPGRLSAGTSTASGRGTARWRSRRQNGFREILASADPRTPLRRTQLAGGAVDAAKPSLDRSKRMPEPDGAGQRDLLQALEASIRPRARFSRPP